MIQTQTIYNAINANVILNPRESDRYRADGYEGFQLGYLLLIYFAYQQGFSKQYVADELCMDVPKVEKLEKRLSKLLMAEESKLLAKVRLIEKYFQINNHK
jgi:hypothetical protein